MNLCVDLPLKRLLTNGKVYCSMNEKISVILPVYKSEEYILECLKSIVNQTYKPYELILVSDGCVDNSIDIAKNYLSSTEINYLILEQKNQGVASARNKGFEKATGDWVIAIDSDDCIYPHTFELLMEYVNEEEVLAIDFGQNLDKEEEPLVTTTDVISLKGEDALLGFYSRKYKFVSPALLLKKSFLISNNITYDVGCRFAEDDIYVWKVLCTTSQVLYIRKPLYNYIFHQGSTMTTSNIEKFVSVKQNSIELDNNYVQKSANVGNLKDIILYRHYIGLLHAAAKVQSYTDFKELIKHYDLQRLYRERYHAFKLKNKILFSMPLICPHVLYSIFRVK